MIPTFTTSWEAAGRPTLGTLGSFTVFTVLLACPCQAAGQSTGELHPALEKAIGLVEETWDILDEHRSQLWPGWRSYRSLAFATGIPPTQDILINPAGIPEGPFVQLSSPPVDVDVYSRRPSSGRGMWGGSSFYSVGEDRHRAVRFWAPTEEMADSAFGWSAERYFSDGSGSRFRPLFHHDSFIEGIIVHEAFHLWQVAQNNGKMRGINHETLLSAAHPERDRLLREEGRLLTELFVATDREEALPLAREFLEVRQRRRGTLTEEDILFERLTEWKEGLATYAETKAIQLHLDAVAPSLSSLLVGFRIVQIRTASGDNRSERDAEHRCYLFGMALGYALDLFYGTRWKEEVLKDGVYLDRLLEEAVEGWGRR